MLVNVKSCPCLYLSTLFEGSRDPQLLAASTGLGCLQSGAAKPLGWLFNSMGPCSDFREDGRCGPHPRTTHLSLSWNISLTLAGWSPS